MSEMTAVEFLKERKRMCVYYESCGECPMQKIKGDRTLACSYFCFDYPEEAVAVVQKWAEQRPANTRQSKFLKIYPNAAMNDGAIKLCPQDLNTKINCRATSERISCNTCRKDYWLQEVK